MPIIPEIVIGKKYLWRIEAWEWQCPNCEYVAGSGQRGREKIVTVLRVSSGIAMCDKCNTVVPISDEGIYACLDENNKIWSIPYTQLFELEEVDE